MLKHLGIVLLFCCFSSVLHSEEKNSYPLNAYVEAVNNARYFPALMKAIQSAEKSIHVCMYYISCVPGKNGKVEQILKALVDAGKRGVKVEVLLDRDTEKFGSDDLSKKNIRAFSYLTKNGIAVSYDDVKILTHSKYFILDEETIFVGSFNLSENALASNRESAVLVRSKEIAKEFLEDYLKIPKYTPGAVKGAIPIPREFIRNKNLASAMAVNRSRNLIDLYLLLQYRSYKGNTDRIVLTKEDILENFYYNTERNFKGIGVLAIFKKENLKKIKDYPFIRSYEHDEKNQQFVFYLPEANRAKEDSLYVSELYWQDNWYKRLSNRSKWALFYMLDKTDSGRMGRYFTEGKWDAAKEYQVGHTLIAYGTGDLQRWNLIDKEINYEIGENNPNGYYLNDFYVYADFEKELQKLKAETDAKIFEAACGLADSVDEVNDMKVYKRFVELGQKYGVEPLDHILKLCRERKNGASPYRDFDYVEQAVINKAMKGRDIPA